MYIFILWSYIEEEIIFEALEEDTVRNHLMFTLGCSFADAEKNYQIFEVMEGN